MVFEILWKKIINEYSYKLGDFIKTASKPQQPQKTDGGFFFRLHFLNW